MAFFLRKAFKFGPLRVNLSKSGVGASVGVTGARLGVRSSDGQPYVYGGRYGLYYRQNLGSVKGEQIERAAEIIAGFLEASKDEWLPVLKTPDDAAAVETAGIVMGRLRDRLRSLGFPIDSDDRFARVVTEIHNDLAVQIAFPETSRDWGDPWDDLLARAGDEVQRIIEREKLDVRTLSDRALRDAAERGDEQLFSKLLASFCVDMHQALVPQGFDGCHGGSIYHGPIRYFLGIRTFAREFPCG